MTTDFPIFTLSLSICPRGSLAGFGACADWAGTEAAAGAAGAAGGGVVGLTDSSRFHIAEILPLGVWPMFQELVRARHRAHPHVAPVTTGITRGLLMKPGEGFRV